MGWELVGNVRGPAWDGILDVSEMTTAAQINTAAEMAGAGAHVWFGNRVVPLVIEDTLVIPPGQRWSGLGGRSMLTRIQAGPNFPAGKPLLAARGYMRNATVADNPIHVEGLHLDCNSKENSHGFVPYNFWSTFYDIQVVNAFGSGASAFFVTDRGIDGATIATNSFSENRYISLRVDKTRGRARGFQQVSHNQASNQDGHLTDSFFAGIDGDAINIGRIAGWTVENNHLYGIGGNAIVGRGGYGSKIQNNYIEDFGNNNDFWHAAIDLGQLDTRASVISGNTISFRPPFNLDTDAPLTPAANRWSGIYVKAGWDQQQAQIVVADNALVWTALSQNTEHQKKCTGIILDCESNSGQTKPAILTAELRGNLLDPKDWWWKRWEVHPNAIVNPDYRSGSHRISGSAGFTPTCEFYRSSVSWDAPSSATPTINRPTMGRIDGDTFSITLFARDTARTVTFGSTLERLTGIEASYSVPVNKKLRALLRYAKPDDSWAVEAVAVTQ